MSTPDTPHHPDRTRNTGDRPPADERRGRGTEADGVDDVPAIGLPAEDVELDRRPRR